MNTLRADSNSKTATIKGKPDAIKKLLRLAYEGALYINKGAQNEDTDKAESARLCDDYEALRKAVEAAEDRAMRKDA